MKTVVEKIKESAIEEDSILRAAGILQRGGLVAFPTETVYGLGANGLDSAACKKIYEAKGRPSDNPLILHISALDELERIVSSVPAEAEKIMEAFWPGPLTLIFSKAACVPKEITGGFETVAVRFPSHPVANALIKAAGLPIAAPSANRSGRPSPTRASHVLADLDGRIDMLLDGGSACVGLESTILDLTGEAPMILRPGAVTKEMLMDICGEVLVDPAVYGHLEPGQKPKAPGMKYTHYSPKAEVVLVQGPQTVEYINARLLEWKGLGRRAGVIAADQTKNRYLHGVVLSLGDRENLEQIGASLFHVLRQCDCLELEIVYAEMFGEAGEGAAIMNRLRKAAGYQIVNT